MKRYLTLLLMLSLPVGLSCATPELTALTAHYARSFGLDENLVIAVVWVESRFCHEAVSSEGAVGLGQIMPGTAAALGIDATNVEQNLWGTAKYLRVQYEAFGNWPLALAAYNAGPGNVRKYGGIPPFEETQAYVKRVLEIYSALKRRRADDRDD